MRRPDAPWVGKCKEDYYGWDDEACLLHCECCDCLCNNLHNGA